MSDPERTPEQQQVLRAVGPTIPSVANSSTGAFTGVVPLTRKVGLQRQCSQWKRSVVREFHGAAELLTALCLTKKPPAYAMQALDI